MLRITSDSILGRLASNTLIFRIPGLFGEKYKRSRFIIGFHVSVDISSRQAQLLHHGHHVEVVPHRFGLAAFDFDDPAGAHLDALAGCRYLSLRRLHRSGVFSVPGHFQYDFAAADEGDLEGCSGVR